MRGSYILLIRVPEKAEIRVGSLGLLEFQLGFYAYVGSAMNSIEARTRRHLRKEKKKFWHIDYLLEGAEVVDVIVLESNKKKECKISENLTSRFQPVRNFGSSDCRCDGHLFYLGPSLPSHLAKVINAV